LVAFTPGIRGEYVFLPVAVIAVFSLTEDFDLHHYFNINTAEINYRINYSPQLREHYKSRRDARTPSVFVNERLQEDDVVIIGESEPEFYLDRVDYRYKKLETKNFPGHIHCGIEHDRWSNAPVLYKDQQLDEVIETAAGDVWVIETRYIHDEWQQQWSQFEVFTAPDQRTHVLRIPRGTGAPPSG
jgi:hypothetical protein